MKKLIAGLTLCAALFAISGCDGVMSSDKEKFDVWYLGSLSPPSNVTATVGPAGSNSIYVSWSQVSGANTYYVYRSDNSGSHFYWKSTNATSYTDPDVPPGTYSYKVSTYSYNGGGRESALSASSNSVTISSGSSSGFPPVSSTPLFNGQWNQGTLFSSGEIKWYSFYASSGTMYYYVRWEESGSSSSSSKTCDIKVTAYRSNESVIFSEVDSAYSTPQSISGVSGTVYLKVEGYDSTSTGTYSIWYSTSYSTYPW